MAADSLGDALVHARSLLIDLERHIDRAAAEGDLSEVGRAWVRAAQVERLLRSVLPADATRDIPDVEPPHGEETHSHDAAARKTRRRT
jgi:hypothetical protein